jgi:hypothetical protein
MQDTFVKQASESDLILIDKKVDTAAPWPVWAEQIVQSGFAIVSISPGMQSDFEGLQVLAGGIRFKDKQSFSFVERTDGYFPIGYSFLKEKENSDLCEIFNYWHRFKEDHQKYDFCKTDFYSRIASYEAQVSVYGQKIVDEICRKYEYTRPILTREDSYLQFNHYREDLRLCKKRYLQGKHEDGHLITVIKPNAPGLVIYQDGKECLVDLAKDQAIVIAGSLLTQLSDGDIQPVYHAVLNLTLPAARSSIVYNVNILAHSLPSFRAGADIRMFELANEQHLQFGHNPYVLG